MELALNPLRRVTDAADYPDPSRAPKPQKPPQVFTPESIAMALRFSESARKTPGKRDASALVPHSDSGPSRAAAAQTLGVKEDSADRTVQSAYRKLVRQVHPDKAKSDEDRKVREAATKQVTEAFTALMRKSGAGGALKNKQSKMGTGACSSNQRLGRAKQKRPLRQRRAKELQRSPQRRRLLRKRREPNSLKLYRL